MGWTKGVKRGKRNKLEEAVNIKNLSEEAQKQIVEDVEEITKKQEPLDKIMEMMSNVIEEMKRLSDRMAKLENSKQIISVNIPFQQQSPQEFVDQNKQALDRLVPQEWEKTKNDILGENFEMTIHPVANGDFMMTIVVPNQYDCRQGEDKKMSKADVRTGLITRVSPIRDIQYWCEKIKSNINKYYNNFLRQ